MVKLKFMVVPEELKSLAYVENPVKVRIYDIDAMMTKGLLGDSGRRMAEQGLSFYFEREIAENLIKEGIAKICEDS